MENILVEVKREPKDKKFDKVGGEQNQKSQRNGEAASKCSNNEFEIFD